MDNTVPIISDAPTVTSVSPVISASATATVNPLNATVAPVNPAPIHVNPAAASRPPTSPTPQEFQQGMNEVMAAKDNPVAMQSMIETAMNKITPAVLNQQTQALNNPAQRRKLIAAAKKNGQNLNDLRKQAKSAIDMRNSETSKQTKELLDSSPLVIILRSNKILSKRIIPGMEETHIAKTTGSQATMNNCTNLSFKGYSIFVCSESVARENKRASRLVGYRVNGEVIFGRKEGDLTEDAFLELERQVLSQQV